MGNLYSSTTEADANVGAARLQVKYPEFLISDLSVDECNVLPIR